MNQDSQRRQIVKFLKGKMKKEVDSFCIYQWIDRCHFHEWWDLGVKLSSSIPPNSLNSDYHKRLDFLLAQCRANVRDESSKETQTYSDRCNQFGHRIGTQAACIDQMLVEGLTIEEAAMRLDTTFSRVRTHIYHLKREHQASIIREGNVYKIQSYSVIEEYESPKPIGIVRNGQPVKRRFFEQLLELSNEKIAMFRHKTKDSLTDQTYFLGRNAGNTFTAWNYFDNRVELIFWHSKGEINKRRFLALQEEKREIEAAFGEPLNWVYKEGRGVQYIRSYTRSGGIHEVEKWPEIQEDLVNRMVRLERAIKPYIAQLI